MIDTTDLTFDNEFTTGDCNVAAKSLENGDGAECECRGTKPYMDFVVDEHEKIASFAAVVRNKFKQVVENEKIIKALRDGDR